MTPSPRLFPSRVLAVDNMACRRGDRPLFKGLTWRLDAGSGLRVAGHNGIGKTSLLRVLSGLSSEFSGDLYWCGEQESSPVLPQECLFLGHKPAVNQQLTALENLRWWACLQGLDANEARLLDALVQLGLQGFEHDRSYQLSAGQQRRIALSRMLLSEAPLWVLDEPFTAIDHLGVTRLEGVIQQHCQRGGIVVLTTHQQVSLPMFDEIDLSQYVSCQDEALADEDQSLLSQEGL